MPTNIHNQYGSSRLSFIKVERNIPVPAKRSSRSVLLNTLVSLAVGESVFLPSRMIRRGQVYSTAYYAAKVSKHKFVTRTTLRRNKVGVRVWRWK